MPIQIHGKQYVTVSERLIQADKEIKSITTEVLYQTPVVVKATVVTTKGTFTGISAANQLKAIEKQSPYEVAETSAVGRALGFAGYGITESIASAEEMAKAILGERQDYEDTPVTPENDVYERQQSQSTCDRCGAEKVKNPKTGKWFCKEKCWLQG